MSAFGQSAPVQLQSRTFIRDCGNIFTINIDSIPWNKNIIVTASGARVAGSANAPTKWLITPTDDSCHITLATTVLAKQVVLAEGHFMVIEPPLPAILCTIGGKATAENSLTRVAEGTPICFQTVADSAFLSGYPNDARYFIDDIKINKIENNQKVSLHSIHLNEGKCIPIMAAYGIQHGDTLEVVAANIKRKNYTGKPIYILELNKNPVFRQIIFDTTLAPIAVQGQQISDKQAVLLYYQCGNPVNFSFSPFDKYDKFILSSPTADVKCSSENPRKWLIIPKQPNFCTIELMQPLLGSYVKQIAEIYPVLMPPAPTLHFLVDGQAYRSGMAVPPAAKINIGVIKDSVFGALRPSDARYELGEVKVWVEAPGQTRQLAGSWDFAGNDASLPQLVELGLLANPPVPGSQVSIEVSAVYRKNFKGKKYLEETILPAARTIILQIQ